MLQEVYRSMLADFIEHGDCMAMTIDRLVSTDIMNESPAHGGGGSWGERSSSAIAVKSKLTESPEVVKRRQGYQFHKLRSRDAYHVTRELPDDHLSPDERFARDFGDRGRNSTRTQAYRPLGTPDESIRQLPQLLRPGQRHFKSVNPQMTLGEMFGLST